MAVLRNDLVGACGKADYINKHRIHEIVGYIYNSIPAICWGNNDKVNAWLDKKDYVEKDAF